MSVLAGWIIGLLGLAAAVVVGALAILTLFVAMCRAIG